MSRYAGLCSTKLRSSQDTRDNRLRDWKSSRPSIMNSSSFEIRSKQLIEPGDLGPRGICACSAGDRLCKMFSVPTSAQDERTASLLSYASEYMMAMLLGRFEGDWRGRVCC